ncbi:MAG TPA: helix-turn-helix transcriptional regulator [Ruminiclostridium sp.]|nr:helix-turn-helix transcriptional regulator [Ruminiclostridium sp.]
MMNNAYNKAIGKHLGELRRKKGLTQEQLATKMQLSGCDMTRSALAKIEVGQRCLYPDELKAVKKVLDISYEELFI